MKRKFELFFLIFALSACNANNDISGKWENIIVPDNGVKAFLGYTTENEPIYQPTSPFNTSMYLTYFFDDKNDDNAALKNNINGIYVNEIYRLHKMFDRHYNYLSDDEKLVTNVKTLNESYGTNIPVKCDDELYSLIKLGVECYDLTDGYFNIFTGSITDYWETIFSDLYNYEPLEDNDPYFSESKRNLLSELISRIPHTKEQISNQLTFDDENKTITFNKIVNDLDDTYRPIISVGGIAKGFANDLVKQKLVENSYTSGVLMSGGSSITSLGNPIHSKSSSGQKISVVNPASSTFFESKAAFSLNIDEEFCFSTSGNYTTNKSYNFYDDESNLIYRHHILNPYTGYPESYHRSVSILSNTLSSALVDILTTAMMTLSLEKCFELRNKIISNNPDYFFDMFVLDQNGVGNDAKLTVHATSNVNSTLVGIDGVDIIYEE